MKDYVVLMAAVVVLAIVAHGVLYDPIMHIVAEIQAQLAFDSAPTADFSAKWVSAKE